MKKKTLAVLLTVAMAFSAITGCSSSSGSSSSGSGSASASGSAAASADASSVDFSGKTINFYVTHATGGDTDYMARLLGQELEKELGCTVVCTNVTGSNGAICMTQYKDAVDKDGLTYILTNTAALCGNEATGLADFGYDAFEPVAVYGKQSGENVVVKADAPYDNLGDLIEASKNGNVNFGVSTGGGVYIASVIMKEAGGANFNVIDAGDASARLTALLGGHVDATICPYSTIKDYIESGELKTLGTLLKEAPDLLPDVPVCNDTVPELVQNTEYVCLAPKGTDSAYVEALNEAICNIGANSADWKEQVNSYCFQEPYTLNVEDTIADLKEQRENFMSFSQYLQ